MIIDVTMYKRLCVTHHELIMFTGPILRHHSVNYVLRWRDNERDGVSNHQPHDCLHNRYSGADQRKHQSSASLAVVRGIHQWLVNSPHKWPVTRKMFPFDGVIKWCRASSGNYVVYTVKNVFIHVSLESNGFVLSSLTGGHQSTWPMKSCRHDDVIKWKHFPCYWPFVRGIHRSRWIPRTKASEAEL